MQGYLRQALAQIGVRNFAAGRKAVEKGLQHAPSSSDLLEVQSTLGSLEQAQQRRVQSRTASTSAPTSAQGVSMTSAPAGNALETALATLAQAGLPLLYCRPACLLFFRNIKKIFPAPLIQIGEAVLSPYLWHSPLHCMHSNSWYTWMLLQHTGEATSGLSMTSNRIRDDRWC